MQIVELKVLRGPNIWSVKNHKLIQMLVDPGTSREVATNHLPDFNDRLKALLPSLYNHCCGEGSPGSFLKQVQEGTSLAHVVEHVALEIQSLAGINCCFSTIKETVQPGQHYVVFSYA